MKGRTVIPRLVDADTPVDLLPEVEAVLEVDRLFWLDPLNKTKIEFRRRHVPGEELPKQIPEDAARVQVVVQRWGRTFMVDGLPVLQIVDNDEKKSRNRVKRRPQASLIIDFAAEQRKKAEKRKENVVLAAPELPAEQKEARRQVERDRQAERKFWRRLSRLEDRVRKRLTEIDPDLLPESTPQRDEGDQEAPRRHSSGEFAESTA